jgi:uncharacterized protein (DUF302 family)
MKLFKALLAGMVVSAGMAFANMQMSPKMMFSEIESPYGYEETIQKVTESYKANGWDVLSVKDSDADFVKKGKPSIGKLTNIKVCAGKYAYKMLKNDESKYLVTMMPCGVGVYEKNGKVIVASMNVGFMKMMFEGEIRSILDDVEKDGMKIMSVLQK